MSIFVGRQTPQTRLRIWAQYAKIIEQHMRTAAEDARQDYFEYLYVHRDDNQRTVQLVAGQHPISTNDDGSLQTEGGAALVLSQDSTFGHVASFIYPYETSRGPEKPILWGIFDSPADAAAGKWLDHAVHDFARCCRASSVVDQTVFRSDRLRMRWLRFRSWGLGLRGRLPCCTKLIRAKPSWIRRSVAGLVFVATSLATILNLPSMLSTLSGYTVPALWAKWHSTPPADKAASSTHQALPPVAPSAASGPLTVIPAQPEPAIAPSTAGAEMHVISGRYTFCPTTSGQSSSKLLNLLYDVRTNAGRVAFFNVHVSIDCVLGKQPDYEAKFNRLDESGEVSYLLHVPLVRAGDFASSRQWIDGGRDFSILRSMYSDNGSIITIHRGDDGRNPLSRFLPHVEGSVDILFGPYAIKESSDDDVITLDLNAPFLDTAALQQATVIADRLRGARAIPAPSLPSPLNRGRS